MKDYKILYFRGHELVGSETLEQGDLLDAIERAHNDASGRRAEIWGEDGRVGELGDRFVPDDNGPAAQGLSS